MAKRIGVVGIEGGWSSHRLCKAFADTGCEAHLVDMAHVRVELDRNRVMHQGLDLGSLDALVIKKITSYYTPSMLNRLASLRYLSGSGTRIFSDPSCIKRVIDRWSCTITLKLNGVPIPPTVVTEDARAAIATIERFGSAVLKPLYTSKARGMVLVERADGAREAVAGFQDNGHQTIYIQKRLMLPGRDLGLVFLGGEFLGCYARVAADGSWNTTIRAGGRYERFDPPSEWVELARRAQAPFNLAFTCVDLAETDNGLVVFEVSAFGGFRGLWESQRVDAAAEYARYVLKRLEDDKAID